MNMFKNRFFYSAVFVLIFGVAGCSSNSGSGEDLDISEIQEIEATGEFSEDEFFSDEGTDEVAEEQLVEEVPGLESELAVDLDEEGAGDDFALDLEEETVADTKLEGQDLFDEVALAEDALVEEGADKQSVMVTADDLGFDDELDLGDDEDFSTTGEVAIVESGELELDTEDDLFRDEDFSVEAEPAVAATEGFIEDVTIATNEQALVEDDSLGDADMFNTDTSERGAAELLADNVSIDVDYSNASAPAVMRGLVSVKKMKTVPYSKNGILVNAIYFVRSGDTLASIGDRIYGGGSAVDFRIVNPHLKSGALKVGQKIYYNSPSRGQDRSRLLTYYEDVRMPAQTYSAAEGENIRKLSKTLLGHSRSWMEIWATNQQIESKGALEESTQVRYWNGGSAPAPTLARVEPPAPVEEMIEEELAPESTSQASLDLGAEPEMDEIAELDDPALDDEMLDEPDMELDEPADIAMDDSDFDAAETDLMAENDDMGVVDAEPVVQAAVTADVDGRDIARNDGAFPAKASGVMGNSSTRMGIVGLALLLLLAVGFLVVKRRRESQSGIEMESFDFGGETTIEEAQTKTQVDL